MTLEQAKEILKTQPKTKSEMELFRKALQVVSAIKAN